MQLKLGVECLVESFRDGGGFDRVPRLDRSFDDSYSLLTCSHSPARFFHP